MERKDIFALMDRFEAGSIQRLELEDKGFRLVLDKTQPAGVLPAALPVSAPAPAPAGPVSTGEAPAEDGRFIKAPLVGTFYVASAPGEAPFVQPGDTVHKGQTIGLIEAMKMINEITALCDCVIESLVAQDGALVGFGDPLFQIREL